MGAKIVVVSLSAYPDLVFADALKVVGLPTNMRSLTNWMDQNSPRLHRATVIDGKHVKITSFTSVSTNLPPNYTLGDDPKWITDRIAALMLMPLPPPPLQVENVGLRIDENTFWIMSP